MVKATSGSINLNLISDSSALHSFNKTYKFEMLLKRMAVIERSDYTFILEFAKDFFR